VSFGEMEENSVNNMDKYTSYNSVLDLVNNKAKKVEAMKIIEPKYIQYL